MGIFDHSRRGLWLLLACIAATNALDAKASAAPPVLLRQDDDSFYLRDPAWKPSHTSVGVIKLGPKTTINNFCLNRDGNLLVCTGGEKVEYVLDPKTNRQISKVTRSKAEIQVYSRSGKLLHAWAVPIKPEAIAVAPSGAIYIGGAGKLCQLDQKGQVIARASLPKPDASQLQPDAQGQSVTGIAVTSRDLFVASQSPSDYTYVVHRFTHGLKQPKKVVSGLSGCCGQMDIQAFKGNLWVAHNARHRVEQYDRDGKKLSEFGREDRKAADAFGGCCEPKNLRFTSTGFVYTAESGPPTVVKRFNLRGDFLGVVAVPDFQTGCVRVTVEASRDNKRLYVLNGDGNEIHVFANARSNVSAMRR